MFQKVVVISLVLLVIFVACLPMIINLIAATLPSTIGTYMQNNGKRNEDEMSGFIDERGNKLFSCHTLGDETLSDMRDGRCRKYSSESCCFMLKSGVMLPQRFLEARDFSENLAVAKDKNKLWGVVCKNGTWVVLPQFSNLHSFSNGLAAFKDKEGKWGFLNHRGEIVIKAKFSDVGDFDSDVVPAKLENKWGIFHKNNHWITLPKFTKLSDFKNGTAVALHENFVSIVNTQGQILLSYKSEEQTIGNIQKFLAVSGHTMANERDVLQCLNIRKGYAIKPDRARFGIIDANQQWVVKPNYRFLSRLDDNLFCAMDTESKACGIVHISGALVVPFAFRWIEPFGDCNLAKAYTLNYLSCYINRSGSIVIKHKEPWIRIGNFSEGCAPVMTMEVPLL